MSDTNRRTFLKRAGAGATALAISSQPNQARAAANEKITLGVIGCGGRGSGVAQQFAGEENCEVAYVCDPDERRAESLAKKLTGKRGNRRPESVADLRTILADRGVDAVLIATPDHWHAPAAILACDAGKHVYVEKPCSHNLRQGRLLVDAARRNKRVVQHGTQSRSSGLIAGGMQMLREGIIGDVLVAKAWNIQR
ncbi:MAG: Gfo/Idh/MocA family oxidoreductase, partial [Planctomycetales bacterium]